MRLFASAAVLATLLATSAVAQEAPAAPPAAQPEAGKKDAKKVDGVICHRETPTGSMFAVKVCTTAEQRKAQSEAARTAQGKMQSAAPQIPQ